MRETETPLLSYNFLWLIQYKIKNAIALSACTVGTELTENGCRSKVDTHHVSLAR